MTDPLPDPPPPAVFGHWDAPVTDDGTPIDVPTHLECVYCGERFRPGDDGAIFPFGGPQHKECAYRSVMGGIGHHVDHARYCHGPLGPDAGLPRRQSALLVWSLSTTGRPVTESDLERLRQQRQRTDDAEQ